MESVDIEPAIVVDVSLAFLMGTALEGGRVGNWVQRGGGR